MPEFQNEKLFIYQKKYAQNKLTDQAKVYLHPVGRVKGKCKDNAC